MPERSDVPPPPDWRLEAIAHDVRPRSLTVGPDGRTAVFIEDRDTSDLHVLDLGTDGAAPERLTTGREVMPYWEDTQPRISPDGTTVAYGQGGDVWLVPVDRRRAAPARRGRRPRLARRRAACSSRSSTRSRPCARPAWPS